jgi:hypothetical protein
VYGLRWSHFQAPQKVRTFIGAGNRSKAVCASEGGVSHRIAEGKRNEKVLPVTTNEIIDAAAFVTSFETTLAILNHPNGSGPRTNRTVRWELLIRPLTSGIFSDHIWSLIESLWHLD